MKSDRLTAYLRLARSIAEEYGTNSLWALLRMRYCWMRYGFNAKTFIQYGFYPQGLSAPSSYIKKRDMETLQNRVNPPAARELVDDKLRFQQRCAESGLPTPPILGLINGADDTCSEGAPLVTTPHQLLTLLDRCGAGTYLLKPARGFLGAGITRFEFKRGDLFDDDRQALDPVAFLDRLLDQGVPLILQPYLAAHPDLHPLMPGGCLGTTRIVTINDNGRPRVLFACTKIPVGNIATDNFQSGTSGNLIGDVDLATGTIRKSFGARREFPGFIEEAIVHPDSAVVLKGFRIPCWDEILDMALAGARAFPELGTIGWDIALTDEGPSLIEGNARYGPDPHQVCLERGLKDYFTLLLTPLVPESTVRRQGREGPALDTDRLSSVPTTTTTSVPQ